MSNDIVHATEAPAGVVYGPIWAKSSPMGRVDLMIWSHWFKLTPEQARRLRDQLTEALGEVM